MSIPPSESKNLKWPPNNAGQCYKCGYQLDFYDSKYIERAEPHRMVCVWKSDGAEGAPGCEKPFELDERDWYYWTDG